MSKEDVFKQIELMGEIVALAGLITTYTESDIFARYSPHIQTLEVEIYENGWSITNSSDIIGKERIGNNTGSLSELIELKDNLLDILRDKKIDYRNFDYNIRQYKEYVWGNKDYI